MPYKDTSDPRQKIAQKKYYEANKDLYKSHRDRIRSEIQQFIGQYKESRGCTDCGVHYPAVVLDLDHLPGTEKLCNPSQLVHKGSWSLVHSELAKCEVVCANCHRLRTQQRQASVAQ